MSFAPKKSLGQNFLQDPEISRWIANQIEPDGADLVIEVGPGKCAMTEHLVGRPKKLLLLEKDYQLAEEITQRFESHEDVELWQGDASRFDKRGLYAHGPVKLIGNLPYSMGGEIMKNFLTPPTPIGSAVFMLQKEVCERLAATKEDDAYSALSLLTQHDWDVEILRVIPPEVFKPKPKVDSAIVKLIPKKPGALKVHDRANFVRLVKMGFSQRRKQMKKLLPEAPGGWDKLCEALGKAPTMRAEELSLEDWVNLTRFYEQRGGEDLGQKSSELFDVVDESNQVVGQRTRGEVHAEGLRHRAVHIFVFNKHGELWLQKRSHLKDVHPNDWDSSAAGHLDAGENYEQAAIRELKEELGIEVTSEKIAEIAACEDTGWEFVELHQAQHSGPMKFAPEEIVTGAFFTLQQIDAWVKSRPQDFAKGFLRCYQLYRKA